MKPGFKKDDEYDMLPMKTIILFIVIGAACIIGLVVGIVSSVVKTYPDHIEKYELKEGKCYNHITEEKGSRSRTDAYIPAELYKCEEKQGWDDLQRMSKY